MTYSVADERRAGGDGLADGLRSLGEEQSARRVAPSAAASARTALTRSDPGLVSTVAPGAIGHA